MENIEKISCEDVIRYAVAVMSIGTHPKISQYRMLQYASRYAKGEYTEVITMVEKDIRLNAQLAVQFVAHDFIYPVYISIVNSLSWPQRSNQLMGVVKIRKSLCAYPWEIFVALLVREFSRVLLKSSNHPLATNKAALDICSIALGFGPVILQGFENAEALGIGRISRNHFRLASNVINSGFRQSTLRVPCFVSM